MNPRFLFAFLVLGTDTVLPAKACAQQFAYVTTLGSDTLALERYELRGDSIVGDYATAIGGILVHHYVIHINAGGAIDRLSMTVARRGAPAHDSLDFALRGDTAILFDSRWRTRRYMRAPGFFPMFVGVNALEETAVTYARHQRSDSLTIPIFAVWANFDTAHFRVLIYSTDSIGLWSRLTPGVLNLDGAGHVVRANARLTTTRTETVRVPPFDLDKTLATMRDAPPDAHVSAFASLSPRDSSSTTVAGATVQIAYGRPALRGRNVFEHGVLGDSVWRTGANGPTEFVTSNDVRIGGALVRAGRYTIWTRVVSDGAAYSLIFSSRSGRGCFEYHPDSDDVVVPLRRTSVPTTVDRLTITIEGNHQPNGRLVIRWGTTQLDVPVSRAAPGR